MNKLLKGAIAGAAGLTLLMGGAGTFALWNAEAAVSGGTIVAGDLDIESLTDGVWTNGTTDIAITDYRIVPGDTLTYTQELTVTATGDNMRAVASVDEESFTSSGTAGNALAAFLRANTTVDVQVGGESLADVTFGPTEVTDVIATVTIAFPSGGVGMENAAKLGSAQLENIGVTLTQVLPSTTTSAP